MRYGLTQFKKEIPAITGMRVVTSYDGFSILVLSDDAILPEGQYFQEITELEATEAWKYYGEVRGYRSAYSDLEGLEPDPESLAQGKRKTKVYMTTEITAAVITLMKRIFKLRIDEIFESRESKEYQQDILDYIDSLTTIKELTYERERLIGVEMSKTQLLELYLWDTEINSRKGLMTFKLGF